MVWCGDDHRGDVIAIQHAPEIAGAELRFLLMVRDEALLRIGDLGLVDVAERDS